MIKVTTIQENIHNLRLGFNEFLSMTGKVLSEEGRF